MEEDKITIKITNEINTQKQNLHISVQMINNQKKNPNCRA